MSPFFTPSNVKLPSMSVMFPLVVPFTITEAPGTGPSSSSTVPETFPSCWEMFALGWAGIVSANILAGKHVAPASKSKLIGLKFFKNGSVVVAEWGFCVVVRIKAVRDAGVLFRDETESAVLPFCAVHVTVLHIALILMADIRASRGAAEFQVGCMAV